MGSLERLIGNNCALTQNWSIVFNVLGDIMVKLSRARQRAGLCMVGSCRPPLMPENEITSDYGVQCPIRAAGHMHRLLLINSSLK